MRYAPALALLRDRAHFHKRGPYRPRRTASRAGQLTAVYRWVWRLPANRAIVADACRREEANGTYYTGD